MSTNSHSVTEHFEKSEPQVRAIYAAILTAARKWGSVTEDPKKTSIHLVRKTAFAGIATRKAALILTLKSDSDIRSERIAKREQASAHRWHLEVKLEKPQQVNRELIRWLEKAYQMSG